MASYLASIIPNEVQRESLLTVLKKAFVSDCKSNTHVRNIAFCFVGNGGTGKTTCLEVISSVFADKGKVVTRLDGKTYREIHEFDPDTLAYSHVSDLYTHDEDFMKGSDLKSIVGDIGGVLLMSALERPDMDPLDHGLRWRVTFIDVQRPTDEVKTFDKDEACRSLLEELTMK